MKQIQYAAGEVSKQYEWGELSTFTVKIIWQDKAKKKRLQDKEIIDSLEETIKTFNFTNGYMVTKGGW